MCSPSEQMGLKIAGLVAMEASTYREFLLELKQGVFK